MRKLLSLIIISITALGQSQTEEIPYCYDSCYHVHVKNSENMGNEELCRAMKHFYRCLYYECSGKEGKSPDIQKNVGSIIWKFHTSNFNCDFINYSLCEENCYHHNVKKPGIIGYEELCREMKNFVNCVNIDCEKPELSPDMKNNLQLLLEEFKRSNFTCDINF